VLPSRLNALALRLLDLGAAVVAAPLPGIAIATWRGAGASRASLDAASEAARKLEGAGLLLSAPPGLEARGAFAPTPGEARLIAGLKARFDPADVLEPLPFTPGAPGAAATGGA
jgi:hypothetical protein